jgi:DNA-binding MurR/RpiR family transcriptional regulator
MAYGPKSKQRRARRVRTANRMAQTFGYEGAQHLVRFYRSHLASPRHGYLWSSAIGSEDGGAFLAAYAAGYR